MSKANSVQEDHFSVIDPSKDKQENLYSKGYGDSHRFEDDFYRRTQFLNEDPQFLDNLDNKNIYPDFTQEEQKLIISFKRLPYQQKNLRGQDYNPNFLHCNKKRFSKSANQTFNTVDSFLEDIKSELKPIFHKYGYEIIDTTLEPGVTNFSNTFEGEPVQYQRGSRMSSELKPEVSFRNYVYRDEPPIEEEMDFLGLFSRPSFDVKLTPCSISKGPDLGAFKNHWFRDILIAEIPSNYQIDRLKMKSSMVVLKSGCRIKLLLSNDEFEKTIYSTRRKYQSLFTKNKKVSQNKGRCFEDQVIENLNSKFKHLKGLATSNKKRKFLRYLNKSEFLKEVQSSLKEDSPEESVVDKCLEFVEREDFGENITVSNVIRDELAHLIMIIASTYGQEINEETIRKGTDRFEEYLQRAVVYANLPQLLYNHSKEQPVKLVLNNFSYDYLTGT